MTLRFYEKLASFVINKKKIQDELKWRISSIITLILV